MQTIFSWLGLYPGKHFKVAVAPTVDVDLLSRITFPLRTFLTGPQSDDVLKAIRIIFNKAF
jgi:hypothetical protein